MKTSTVLLATVAQTSVVSATWWGSSSSSSWGSVVCSFSWLWGQSCNGGSTTWTWPPQVPSGCPQGYPWAQVPWNYNQWKFPGVCPGHPSSIGPVYPSGCNSNPVKKPTPITTTAVTTSKCPITTKGTTTTTTKTITTTAVVTPTAPVWSNFTIACPNTPAGEIFDGQIQCNSPYPAQEVAAGRLSFVKSTFYLKNGGLYDQLGRGCEISSGNQLQCNALVNGATAEVGFAIDSSSNLIWQGENTWYGCNIGTDSSYGQIIFTGTHKDFSGVQAATENANCAAYRLGVVFI